ncbi:---NA--- : Ribosomal subunit interface protein OS=Candidatus Accumulibacter sp. SK-12 GN=AW08_02343 PE=4 SV=1: Ribosomal_S30AE [Gemmataceae bacterium]|nr:---NA--- : Ribosomal subunit interface protein OS=Candidatus Accumulibacter sp. SK-12 GN=AW08_02343 PE=4 SV=1: Ribosomal_S30AE [Gemmataceae bacterium]VTT99613.1 ---NA--- : Ribosomal subunit interface protein OS=Candidatus Accumulibacter sp. SK-12 GN=AW08_02343 PE=4 SV=1: Ribosomal_S30AE [Gemmataceae bacterium]
MWVEVIGRGVEVDEAVRYRVERRLRFALGRFGGVLGRVAVHSADVNGPRGGVDKQCRVVADVTGCGYGPVVVQNAAADLAALIDRAADRAGRAVRRRMNRARLSGWRAAPAASEGN